MLMQRVKPLARILAEGSDETHGLKRSLGPWALTAMGIGAIIGAIEEIRSKTRNIECQKS